MRDRWRHVSGQLLLTFAALWHRYVASDAVGSRLKVYRNLALSGAHRRGVKQDVLAARLGLSGSRIRKVLNNPRGEAREEAGLKPVPPLKDEQLPDAG